MEYNAMGDVEVIRRIRKGDNDAMDYLLKKYRGMVRKETRKLYLIGADEEDLTQEGMIGLFKAIRNYDLSRDTEFALFAHVCIVRQLCSVMTASNRQKHTPLNTYISFYAPLEKEEQQLTLQEVLVGRSDNPEQQMLDEEGVREIWKKIDEVLSPMEKKVLNLYLEGYSYETIGEKLGKEKKSIDNAIQRIRNKLSKTAR
ncbi:MAG: RNA polymerase sporulation sigma factor SigH [Lachnospiraceae bacterium]|nr:RNA polymerase sporulation sigma factor SigH [Lachnospiraceae bacterium]